MKTLQITVSDDMAEAIETRGRGRGFDSSESYVVDLVKADLAHSARARLEALDAHIAEGLRDMEEGRVEDAEVVFARIEASLARASS
jgi:predicted transcriptional regulator